MAAIRASFVKLRRSMSSSKWGSLSPFPTSLPKPPNDSASRILATPFNRDSPICRKSSNEKILSIMPLTAPSTVSVNPATIPPIPSVANSSKMESMAEMMEPANPELPKPSARAWVTLLSPKIFSNPSAREPPSFSVSFPPLNSLSSCMTPCPMPFRFPDERFLSPDSRLRNIPAACSEDSRRLVVVLCTCVPNICTSRDALSRFFAASPT